MKSEHLNAAELVSYRQRNLSPNELLSASDHLASCATCRVQLLQLPPVEPTNAFSDVTYEELVAWVDDKLAPIDRFEVQAKFAHSSGAQRELADLLRFKTELDQPAVASASNVVPVFFGRWILPLAAAVALTFGGIWWILRTPSNSGEFVRLNDRGRDLRITRGGESAAFSSFNSSLRAALKTAVLEGQLHIPTEVSALAGRAGTLAGENQTGAPAFAVLAPITTVLRDGKPRFRWTAFPGANAYRIRVMDTKTDELVRTETVSADQPGWSPEQPLEPGGIYEWEVEALRDDAVLAKAPAPPQPEARFAVISAEKRRELEKLDEHSRGSHLVAGVTDAQMGLLDDAAVEFAALAKENPDSEIPQRLLEQIARAKVSALR